MPSMQFRLPASGGYTLQVKTEGELTKITLARGHPRVSATYYVSHSAYDSTIEADLGSLGRIDVRFEPSGEFETIQVPRRARDVPGCRVPRRLVRQVGTFSGTIAFHGENGYSAVDAADAWGSLGPSARPRCGGATASSNRARGPGRRRVERVWVLDNAFLINHSPFSAATNSATYFAAMTEAKRARYLVDRVEVPTPTLAITRRVDIAAARPSFSYAGDLRSATVRPPAPFSGEATYSARPNKLSGDLAVQLPGMPAQRLTGGDFETRIGAKR